MCSILAFSCASNTPAPALRFPVVHDESAREHLEARAAYSDCLCHACAEQRLVGVEEVHGQRTRLVEGAREILLDVPTQLAHLRS